MLTHLWEARRAQAWDDESYVLFGRKAIALGQPTLGFDIVSEGLSRSPEHRELSYLAALALARSGSVDEASRRLDRLLSKLNEADPLSSNVFSLAGRVAKDRWSKLPPGGARDAAGERARAMYLRAYEISRDYFPGINAATMSLLTGDKSGALRLAAEVQDACVNTQTAQPNTEHWLMAAEAEAHLLLGCRDQAIRCYAQAAAGAGRNFGDIASMRRQVRLLSEAIEGTGDVLQALAVPRVVAFTGQMIDEPGRRRPRFPPALEPAVTDAVAAALERVGAGFGYGSAACGADIIILEQLICRGAEVDVVLPFRREDFVRESVAIASGDWVERFDQALARAASVTYGTTEDYLGDDALFDYAGKLVQGMALLRARQLEVEPLLVAVLDAGSEAKIGGALGSVEHWRSLNREMVLLHLAEIRARALPATVTAIERLPSDSARTHGGTWGRRVIKTMLFADMVGFSKLTELDAPSFFVNFLGKVATTLEASRVKPDFWNTWGDGLFLVFDSVTAGAEFALDLRDAVVGTDWTTVGLPPGINIRIGMHAGPVFPALDPIIQRQNFFGSHVNRAARVEPVTAPGSVFVTEQMAALLAASGTTAFACEYLGPMELAKLYATSRLYRLRRGNESE